MLVFSVDKKIKGLLMWYHWGLPVESRTSLGWSSVCLDFLLSHF